jgi:glycosyltransferase involved in cell wall biosynthesis
MTSFLLRKTRMLYLAMRWRLFSRPRTSTIQHVKDTKERRARAGVAFVDEPRISVIVQSFNQRRNIKMLEPRLRLTCAEELIVCEDGSIDGSHDEWRRRLVRPNDFLIHSNDIHEIRAYSRAIDYARGEIVCLMQDDDRPPKEGSWLAEAADVFTHYPRLAVLGCWCGFNSYFSDEYNAPWLPPDQGRILSLDPNTLLPLMFVENVNIGPYLIRKSVYEQLGGFDLRFSAPGEPGITFEAEYCYRVWRNGYQVALSDIPVKMEQGEVGYILPGGTSLWGQDARVRNERVNKMRIRELYDHELPEIQAFVKEANSKLTSARDPS